MAHTPKYHEPTIPCVVQIGFAGSRNLFDAQPDADTESRWLDLVANHVEELLNDSPVQAIGEDNRLYKKLNLSCQHFFCGISQVSCGADTTFTRACRKLKIPQRIFLPQPVEEYLSAVGSNGTPDFTSQQRSDAESLLMSEHIIEQRVAARSTVRHDRFRETNAEILRVSDVIVCVLRAKTESRPGGTNELLDRAKGIGIPTLEIRVSIIDGSPKFVDQWHMNQAKPYRAPSHPEPLHKLSLPANNPKIPSSREFRKPLKDWVSSQASWFQKMFRYAAALIIAAHVLATICATLALALHGGHNETGSHAENFDRDSAKVVHAATETGDAKEHHEPRMESWDLEKTIPWLLGLELILLVIGFLVHQLLHRSEAARIWANSRVTAELARSIKAIHPSHIYLEHLFRISLPKRFRHLLRTLNVLHLRSTYANRNDNWQQQRDIYISSRIEGTDGQICYYSNELPKDESRQSLCRRIFIWSSVIAIAATALKLLLIIIASLGGEEIEFLPLVLGTLAIVLPVFAVAGVSWGAALDCEARIATFRDTLDFLEHQKIVLRQADTVAEYERLLIETETVLLGENADWFSRRANTGVA